MGQHLNRLNVDEVYLEGLAVCEHWHFGEDEPDEA